VSAGSGAPTRDGSDWHQRPERSNLFALRLMRWIALHLGRPVARWVLWPITLYFLCVNTPARRASRDYLARVHGRPARLGAVARHIYGFAATILDRLYLLNDRFELFDIAIDPAAEALMQAQRASGRGALLFGAHLGSFEVTRALGRQHPGQRIAMTMYEDNARKINATLAAINPAARPDVIPLGRIDTMLQVRDALADGAQVGLLADRSLGDEDCRPMTLLGAPARLPTGPFRMAALLRQPVIFMAGLYLGGNRYRIRFVPLADFTDTPPAGREAAISAAMAAYAAEIERCCREAPGNWFNFFDFWDRPAP
jgi:predicted LPLAT superfamily acyltransferase